MIDRRRLILGGTLLALLIAAQAVFAEQRGAQLGASSTTAEPIKRISTGVSGSGGGSYAAVSETGRYVVFESAANDLAPGVISDSWEVYVHDQEGGLLERASTRSGGGAVYNPGDYTSPPSVSADGRFVAFMSRADNLVDNDRNGWPDIFLHDRDENTTILVSASTAGGAGNEGSYTPVISADGRFVAFQSFASNLVSGDKNNSMDVFIREIATGKTELVSVTNEGVQGSDPHDYGFPGLSVSADGNLVAFAYANLPVSGSSTGSPGVYLRDRQADTTQWIQVGQLPALSGDGRFLALVTSEALATQDTQGGQDVYVLNRITNEFERVTLASDGAEGTGADGAYIESPPSLSADGRYVAFETTAGLDPGDDNALSDIYLHDRQVKSTLIVSAAMDGGAGNGASHYPALSADGTTIAFASMASNLIADDTNNLNDIFIFRRSALGAVPVENPVYLPIVVLIGS